MKLSLLWKNKKRKTIFASIAIIVFSFSAALPSLVHGFFISENDVYLTIFWILAKIIQAEAALVGILGKIFTAIMLNRAYLEEPYVLTGWAVSRDLVNLFFILFLIAIAIMAILRVQQNAARKLLPRFIAAVLLVNFSYFISDQILGFVNNIASGFIQPLAFIDTVVYDFVNPQAYTELVKDDPDSAGSTVVGVLIAAIFFGLLIVSFAILTIAMVIRYIVISILVVLSPFSFLFITLPQTQSLSIKWWKTFLGFSIWGLAASFFVWLALITMVAPANSSPLVAAANSLNLKPVEDVEVTVGMIMKLVVASVMLIIAVLSGKIVAGQAGDLAIRGARRAGRLLAAPALLAGAAAIATGRKGIKTANELNKSSDDTAIGRLNARARARGKDRRSTLRSAFQSGGPREFLRRTRSAFGLNPTVRTARDAQQAREIDAKRQLSKPKTQRALQDNINRLSSNRVRLPGDDFELQADLMELIDRGETPDNLKTNNVLGSLRDNYGFRGDNVARVAQALVETSKRSSKGDPLLSAAMRRDDATGAFEQRSRDSYQNKLREIIRGKFAAGPKDFRGLNNDIFPTDNLTATSGVGDDLLTDQGYDFIRRIATVPNRSVVDPSKELDLDQFFNDDVRQAIQRSGSQPRQLADQARQTLSRSGARRGQNVRFRGRDVSYDELEQFANNIENISNRGRNAGS